MRVPLISLLLIAFLPPQAACSLFRSRYQDVVVTSSIPARIEVDGGYRGKASTDGLVLQGLARSWSHYITAKAAGYLEQSQTVHSTVSGWGALDAVAALLLVFPVVPFITGQAFELDPGDVHFELEPVEPAGVPGQR